MRYRLAHPVSASLALAAFAAAGCGSSTTTTSGVTLDSLAGTYAAQYTGTYQNSSPNADMGTTTSSATITVTKVSANELQLSWQVPPNPPSGTAVFVMSGSSGALADAGTPMFTHGGTAVGGTCFMGVINGNQQTNCCTDCTVSFSGNTMTQPNTGVYEGVTPQNVTYQGNYSGTWTGTRQ